jgi:MoxR-like ATPase
MTQPPLRCHLLIGPPGSGKTTLARDLAPYRDARLLDLERLLFLLRLTPASTLSMPVIPPQPPRSWRSATRRPLAIWRSAPRSI